MNEAFAARDRGARQLGLADDAEHVNPHGGAIALGHPLACPVRGCADCGERDGDAWRKRAIATMCIGVGQGIAALIERV